MKELGIHMNIVNIDRIERPLILRFDTMYTLSANFLGGPRIFCLSRVFFVVKPLKTVKNHEKPLNFQKN